MDLAEVDAGGARESGLRETGLLAEASEDLADWAVCPRCDGREGDELVSTRCDWCTFGVVELAPRIEVVVGER